MLATAGAIDSEIQGMQVIEVQSRCTIRCEAPSLFPQAGAYLQRHQLVWGDVGKQLMQQRDLGLPWLDSEFAPIHFRLERLVNLVAYVR